MTEDNKIIVGLDIGTTKISAIISKKNDEGKFEILGHGKSKSLGVKRGEVANIDKTVNAITEAVNEAQSISTFPVTDVYVGIAGQHIKSMQHRGILTRENSNEEITAKDVKKIIKDMHRLALEPGMQIIHVIPQEYYIDGLAVGNDPIGMCGTRLEADFHVITGRTSAAFNIERSVKRAGLNMVGLILEPLASAASVLDDEEKEAGVVLVDIGGGTTDVAIFYKNVIRHTCVIPYGGNIITKDIETATNIVSKQAEDLKVKFGEALALSAKENTIVSIPGIKGRRPKEISLKNLSNIIQARVEEIFEQVRYEIKISGYAKKMGAGIVVTGGGSQLKNIKQLVEFVTGLDARIGQPLENLAKGFDVELKNPIYATCLGLLDRSKYEAKEETKEIVKEEIKEEILPEKEEELLKNTENRPIKNWWKKMKTIIPQFLNDEDDFDE